MYRQNILPKTTLRVNNTYTGETIEQKVRRILNNKEPITDGAPLTYTERKDGVLPQYDIRTDRWDIAIEAMDKVYQSKFAERQARIDALTKKDDKTADTPADKKDSGAEPIQGT